MHRKKGDFDMYTVRFQLELSGSEKRFLSKSFRIIELEVIQVIILVFYFI